MVKFSLSNKNHNSSKRHFKGNLLLGVGLRHSCGFNPNYALVGFNPDLLIQNSDLATLGFHQKSSSLDNVKTKVLLSRCEAEKMLMHFLD